MTETMAKAKAKTKVNNKAKGKTMVKTNTKPKTNTKTKTRTKAKTKAKAKTKTLCWHMKRQEQLHTGMNCASKSRDLWATSQQFPLRYKCGGSRTILYASEPIVSLHL